MGIKIKNKAEKERNLERFNLEIFEILKNR